MCADAAVCFQKKNIDRDAVVTRQSFTKNWNYDDQSMCDLGGQAGERANKNKK